MCVHVSLDVKYYLLHIEHMGCWINAWVEDRVFEHNLGDITIWIVLWYVNLKPEQKVHTASTTESVAHHKMLTKKTSVVLDHRFWEGSHLNTPSW